MWKRFLLSWRSIILSWLFSYLVILLVPVLISFFVYTRSQNILKSEIHRANDVLLKEVRGTIDNHIQNADRLTTELIWNVRIRGFMYSNLYKAPGSLDPDLYSLHQTAQEIAIYQSLYPSVKTYYVYWKDQDLVLEPGVYRSSKLAFETIHQNEQISYNVWLEILQQNNAERFIKLQSKDAGGSVLAYIHSFPKDKWSSPPGAAVVLLDTGKLMESIVNAKDFSQGQVMVLNGNKQVLLSTAPASNPLALEDMNVSGETGSYFGKYEGQPSEFMYIKSKNSELIYVTVVPRAQFWQKTTSLRNITYAGLWISLAGGILLSIVFLLRNYSPVSKLLRMLKGSEYKFGAAEGNEFLHIQQAISDTLSEKGQIQLRMKQQSYMLRSNMLARMLKGKLDSPLALDESLAAFDVHFHSDEFAVLLFYVDYEPFAEQPDGLSGLAGNPKLLQFIVTNIVEDLANEQHRGFVCETDDHLACLLNFAPGDRERLSGEARRLAERAQQFLNDKFHIHTLASISGIKGSVEDISAAYREAVDAMEYLVVIGGDREVIAYADIQPGPDEPAETSSGSYYYPLQTERQLMNHVKAGDAAKAESMIRDIIAACMEQSKLSVNLVKCLMFDLIGTLIKAAGELGDAEEGPAVDGTDWITKVMHSESIKEMEKALLSIVREFCAYAAAKQKQLLQSSRSLALQERSAEILAFIAERYDQPNLNISMIGEHFGMTPTYLSKLFKEQTGEGLLDTINRFRMDHAKRLLQDPGNSIKFIASQSGFHDINTFIRTFKKYEGVTPGQYQKTL